MKTNSRPYTYLLLVNLIFFGIILSCNTQPKENTEAQVEQDKVETVVAASDIEKLDYTDYLLSRESKNEVANWLEYNDINSEIEAMKEGNLALFSNDSETLQLLILDLKATIPASVATKPIRARILALENSLLKSHELFNLNGFSKKEKLQALREVFVAMSNLNLQINKKFELDQNNFFNN